MVCRLELQSSSCGTVPKLQKESLRHVDGNCNAVERLRCQTGIWQRALGPGPERLLKPNEIYLHPAHQAATALQRMIDRREVGEGDANLEALVQDCVEATKMLRIVTWEAIRLERFSITPEGLFDELARTADSLLSRAGGDTARRQEFLSEAMPGEADGGYIPPTSPLQKDKYGLDLE